MWIASTLGFYSIVERHRGEWQIRARERVDIENAARTKSLHGLPVLETPDGDYRYRIATRKHERVIRFLAELGEGIRYHNFKDRIKVTPGQSHKAPMYGRVWGIMAELQPGGPYAGHRARASAERALGAVCAVCRQEWVDVMNGEDTCKRCRNEI